MKSLILLLFLLTAGIISFTYAQTPASVKNDAMRASAKNTIAFLFPDFERDIANLQAREKQIQPDKSVTSTPIENRLFTNYKGAETTKSNVARSLKASPAAASNPSDISAKEAMDKLKAAQAAHPVQPVVIPDQGGEANNKPTPVKKKS